MPTLEQVTERRLADILAAVESGNTELTGRARRVRAGEGQSLAYDSSATVGRFGGMKRGFPELERIKDGPKAIAAAIRRGKGKVYQRVAGTVADALWKQGYAPAKKRAPGTLSEAPHPGRKYCKHCRVAHTKGQHRFHGEGSFQRTHLFAFNPTKMKVYEVSWGGGGKWQRKWFHTKAAAVAWIRRHKNELPGLAVTASNNPERAGFVPAVRATRYPAIGYAATSPRGDWRFVDTSTGDYVGPRFRTRAELLADLERYAEAYIGQAPMLNVRDRSEVRSPTRTSTSTKAHTAGNRTVTVTASGSGATHVKLNGRQGKVLSRRRRVRSNPGIVAIGRAVEIRYERTGLRPGYYKHEVASGAKVFTVPAGWVYLPERSVVIASKVRGR